jgi:thioesterase domain-containing protein
MKPFFFGESRRQLFGVYHPASNERASRSHAVLLCYPGIQEYNMTHCAFRKLASSLADQGFPSLRFDYFATGDSMGDASEGDPDEWVLNVSSAAAQLKEMSGAGSISVVGMRLGATLAAKACSEGLAVRNLVVWDPVVRGHDYLRELRALDAEQRILRLLPSAPRRPHEPELLGMPFPRVLERAIEKLDMLALRMTHAENVAVVVSEDKPVYRDLSNALRTAGKKVAFTVAPDAFSGATAATGIEELLWSKPLVAIAESLVGAEP